MRLKKLTLHGFKSFAKKSEFLFTDNIVAIVGPNGSGKSNVVEALRFVLGEQSNKSLRSKSGADLIFKSMQAKTVTNRASVSIVFDNRDRVFSFHNDANNKINLDFDEIELKRQVFSDGSNTYSINGSNVRLKDILETITSVNIGSSGHHIISQGEADRLLNANPKERKAMIEDALGLKIYHYRIRESERKLDKTKDNLREVEIARREIAPQLKFLKKEVTKIEKSESMRNELQGLYISYLKQEEVLLYEKNQDLIHQYEVVNGQLADVERVIAEYRSALEKQGKTQSQISIEHTEKQLAEVIQRKEELSRQLGRLEGMIEAAEKSMVAAQKRAAQKSKQVSLPLSVIEKFFSGFRSDVRALMNESDTAVIRDRLQELDRRFEEFLAQQQPEQSAPAEDHSEVQAEIKAWREQYAKLLFDLEGLIKQEQALMTELADLKQKSAAEQQAFHDREKEYLTLSGRKNELNTQKNMLSFEQEQLDQARERFSEELTEAQTLVGESIKGYVHFKVKDRSAISRSSQETLRRQIERLKIKLEDIGGGGGGDVIAQYERLLERDQFLERESKDLSDSSTALAEIISELKQKLEEEFTAGMGQINVQFKEFFVAMFGGGGAELRIVTVPKRRRRASELADGADLLSEMDELEANETGIEIHVSLPRKKVKDLEMLSGGERSLTSIALLFALSQVNPPPFLVLDETDAALDEVNSKKYGDMLENLAKYSQLVVVTHNRETMSRAGILYGITINSGGASQTVSIKFEDAVKIAK